MSRNFLKKIFLFFATASLAVPFFAFAQASPEDEERNLRQADNFVNSVTPAVSNAGSAVIGASKSAAGSISQSLSAGEAAAKSGFDDSAKFAQQGDLTAATLARGKGIISGITGTIGNLFGQGADAVAAKVAAAYTPNVDELLKKALTAISSYFQTFFSYWVYMTAQLLDWSMFYGVIFFGNIAKSNFINQVWQLGRDTANMSFIFLLGYISLSFILNFDIERSKKMIVSLIIIAVFINFSSLLAKVVIDTPNVIAILFYQKLVEAGKKTGGQSKTLAEVAQNYGLPTVADAGGVSGVFVNAMRLQTIYNLDAANKAKDASGQQINTTSLPDKTNLIIASFANIIFIGIAGFVFLVGALMLISRMVTLTFVIMLSSFAFAAYVLPNTRKFFDSWLDALLRNAIFPAVYLFGLYIAAQIVNVLPVSATSSADTFSTAFLGGNVALVFQFIIVMGTMLGAIILGRQVGAHGSDAAIKWGARINAAGLGVFARLSGASTIAGVIAGGGERLDKTVRAGVQRTANIVGATPVVGGFAKQAIQSGYDTAAGGIRKVGTAALNPIKTGAGLLESGTEAVLGKGQGINIYQPSEEKEAKEKRIGSLAGEVKKGGPNAFERLSADDQKEVYNTKLSSADRYALLEKAEKENNQAVINRWNELEGKLEPDEKEKMRGPGEAYQKKKTINTIVERIKKSKDPAEMAELKTLLPGKSDKDKNIPFTIEDIVGDGKKKEGNPVLLEVIAPKNIMDFALKSGPDKTAKLTKAIKENKGKGPNTKRLADEIEKAENSDAAVARTAAPWARIILSKA